MHLILYSSILLTASAAYLPLQARVNECEQELQEDMSTFSDGTTIDGTAGIGAEFECPFFYFKSQDCSLDDTNAAKRKVIDGHEDTKWQLTADTGYGVGKVVAEYVLKGENIKVGSGDAAKVGAAIAKDLIDWSPWAGSGPKTFDIADNKCNPWRIASPLPKDKMERLPWEPQVTAPMPLGALYRLMKEQKLGLKIDDPKRNILDGMSPRPGDFLILITQDYFQSNPNNIEQTMISDDVLAFASLVLSYAKAADQSLRPNQSPKLYTTFMPRTEFKTIYNLLKSQLQGDLFALFNNLACYTTDEGGNIVIDQTYCSGTPDKPVSMNKLAELSYTNTAPSPPKSVNIKEWIQSISDDSVSPDKLTDFDVSIDGSIGGLGTLMEKDYKSNNLAPLFEFRDLYETTVDKFEEWMGKVDTSVQDLHKDFAGGTTTTRQIRKRQDTSFCSFNASASAAPTTPEYYYGADPSGAMGYCPDISASSWCNCGDASTYKVLSGDDVCGYTELPPASATLVLSSTNCLDQTSTPAPTIMTVTVVPIPALTISGIAPPATETP